MAANEDLLGEGETSMKTNSRDSLREVCDQDFQTIDPTMTGNPFSKRQRGTKGSLSSIIGNDDILKPLKKGMLMNTTVMSPEPSVDVTNASSRAKKRQFAQGS